MIEDDWEVIVHRDCRTFVALIGVVIVVAALIVFGACV